MEKTEAILVAYACSVVSWLRTNTCTMTLGVTQLWLCHCAA